MRHMIQLSVLQCISTVLCGGAVISLLGLFHVVDFFSNNDILKKSYILYRQYDVNKVFGTEHERIKFILFAICRVTFSILS